MVKEDEEKLGPVATRWWKELLDKKEPGPTTCGECIELLNKWQSIHPHQDQNSFEADKLAKQAAVISFLSLNRLESCLREPSPVLYQCPLGS